MEYIKMSRDDELYTEYRDYCKENIIFENLISNGGTLMGLDTLNYADSLVMCLDRNDIIGIAGLIENYSSDSDSYICQIAIKKDSKRKGVGKGLLNTIFETTDKDYVTCNINGFNTVSKIFFASMGFIRDEKSSEDYGFYLCETPLKKRKDGSR